MSHDQATVAEEEYLQSMFWLEEAGLPLYAQHVGGMDAATLVDIFRAEEHSCLLGTDAVRDGVDVPGRSLRLIVFDRVPWPRPDILHRARKEAWKKAGAGANAYDDMLARLRLKQAYGRLIRREEVPSWPNGIDLDIPLDGAKQLELVVERTGPSAGAEWIHIAGARLEWLP